MLGRDNEAVESLSVFEVVEAVSEYVLMLSLLSASGSLAGVESTELATSERASSSVPSTEEFGGVVSPAAFCAEG